MDIEPNPLSSDQPCENGLCLHRQELILFKQCQFLIAEESNEATTRERFQYCQDVACVFIAEWVFVLWFWAPWSKLLRRFRRTMFLKDAWVIHGHWLRTISSRLALEIKFLKCNERIPDFSRHARDSFQQIAFTLAFLLLIRQSLIAKDGGLQLKAKINDTFVFGIAHLIDLEDMLIVTDRWQTICEILWNIAYHELCTRRFLRIGGRLFNLLV